MKNRFVLLFLCLALIVGVCACVKNVETDGSEDTEASSDAATDTSGTAEKDEPAAPVKVPESFDSFDTEGSFTVGDTVEDEPVIEYGVFRDDADTESYPVQGGDAPKKLQSTGGGYSPAPSGGKEDESGEKSTTPTTSTEPTEATGASDTTQTSEANKPTETVPATEATEPTQTTEPTDTAEPTEPGDTPAPRDRYAAALAALGDYTADVKYTCVVTLSDGSSDTYTYTYKVSKSGQGYSAVYKERGTEHTATFADGKLTTHTGEKTADLTDFFRFCSMVEPIPLSAYFYESSESAMRVSARLPAQDYRATLLNTSGLLSGFDKMSEEKLTMGGLYYRATLDSADTLLSTDFAYDFALEDDILGHMDFDVSVEVDYVW